MFTHTVKFLLLTGILACQIIILFMPENALVGLYLFALGFLTFVIYFEDVVIRNENQCADRWKFTYIYNSVIILIAFTVVFAGEWFFSRNPDNFYLIGGSLLAIAFFLVRVRKVKNENDF